VVISEVCNDDDSNRIATGYDAKNKNAKRIIRINETNLEKQSEILDYLRIIWLTPQMDGLFIGSPSTRRKFLDRLTYNFFPDHAKKVATYEHYSRSRIKIISMGSYDDLWLSGIEKSMAEVAIEISKSRTECLELLNSFIEQQGSKFLKPKLSLRCSVNQKLIDDSQEDVLLDLKSIFRNNRLRDAKAKRSTCGTHLTDLLVVNPSKNINASISSTGEQKGMLISILLGQVKAMNIMQGFAPIILLDEVFTHLDEKRREQLSSELKNLDAQVWITSTELDIEKYFDSPIEIQIDNNMSSKVSGGGNV